MTSAKYLEEKEIKNELENEIRVASDRYKSIEGRVKDKFNKDGEIIKNGYHLDNYWKKADFIKWYIDEKKECCYCKTSSEDLSKFYSFNKSKRKRGQSLEIERVKDTEYTRDNCKLCCYWCNNAKSDSFSIDEFTNIGIAIGVVIKERLREEKLKKELLRVELREEVLKKPRKKMQKEEQALLSKSSAP
jgi:hypothetical protein